MLLLSSLPSQEALVTFSAFLWVGLIAGVLLWLVMVGACVVGIFKSLATHDYDCTLGFTIILLLILCLTGVCVGASL